MSDASWDGAEASEPKRGMPTWAKILLGCLGGCGLLVLVLVLSCVGFASWVSKDPEGFERRVEGWFKDYAGEHWRQFRDAATALETAEGTRALYARSPELKGAFATETDFLKAAEGWRPLLEPVPEEMPMKRGGVQFSQQGRGSFVIGYRNSKGTRIRMTFTHGSLSQIKVEAGAPAHEPPSPPDPPTPEE